MAETAQAERRSSQARKPTPSDRTSAQRESDEPEAPGTSTRGPHESRFARIARRAHEIYEARGGQHGRDMDDWLQAEREIDSEIGRDDRTEE
jgi:hypothetical protein